MLTLNKKHNKEELQKHHLNFPHDFKVLLEIVLRNNYPLYFGKFSQKCAIWEILAKAPNMEFILS